MTDFTTIQVPKRTRDRIKKAAEKRAHKMGVSYISMADYLKIVADEE